MDLYLGPIAMLQFASSTYHGMPRVQTIPLCIRTLAMNQPKDRCTSYEYSSGTWEGFVSSAAEHSRAEHSRGRHCSQGKHKDSWKNSSER